MAKKVYTFEAKATINREKFGAWSATWTLTNDQDETVDSGTTAWKNASSAKKWLKSKAAEKTPRKAVKLLASPETDEKGKPVKFFGSFTFRDTK